MAARAGARVIAFEPNPRTLPYLRAFYPEPITTTS
jgi:NADPH-dependent 2,4-dienoyl-CoA reductase/sulfur reductase-like enzyme